MKTKKHNCAKCPKRDCCCQRANNLIEWMLAESRLHAKDAELERRSMPMILARLDTIYLEEE